MEQQKVIWDGIEFRQVGKSEAEKLEKADKAQIMGGIIDGLSLKHRHQFTGYNKPSDKVKKADAVQDEPLKDWRVYKKIVAEKTGKAANKVTKKMVEEYLKKED